MKARVAPTTAGLDPELRPLFDLILDRMVAKALADANRGARKRSPADVTANTATANAAITDTASTAIASTAIATRETGADGIGARRREGTMT